MKKTSVKKKSPQRESISVQMSTRFDQLHALVTTMSEASNRRIDHLQGEIHSELRDLMTNIDKRFETLENCVDTKLKNHNDYHVNQESRYKNWFKIAFGSIFIVVMLSAAGVFPAVVQIVLPIISRIF